VNRVRLRVNAIAASVALLCACVADAEVRPAVSSALCVPGGVAAIPLERTPGTDWPARVPVKIGALQSQATVIWVGPAADDGHRSWTRSAEQVRAVPIAEMPASPAPETIGGVCAMIELPASGEGALEVAGAPVVAQWLTAPVRLRPDSPVLAVPATIADDRPDPGTPVEYWRWSLVAAHQGARIGEPRGDAADRLWARHVESLWLSGLARVRAVSRGIHDELVEVLAGVAEDPDHGRTVAAWVARPVELQALLTILVDRDRDDRDAAQAALTWVRSRWTCTVWVEEDSGDRVRLAVANPTSGEHVLRLSWSGSAGQSPPVAVVAAPRRVTRAWIDRPPLAPSADPYVTDRARAEALDASDGAARLRIGVGAREYPVHPPGLGFGTFVPPLSLADAQAMSIAPPPAAWRTSASLRRREGKWELFVEAFRAPDAPDPKSDEVVVRIGDAASPNQVLRVTADGSLEMRVGADDGVSAGFMAWSDRWRARVELPESWLPTPGAAQPLMLSVERTSGAGHPRQTAGLPRPAWVPGAASILTDLGGWDDFGH
jgi:hypothetical protein